VVSGTSARAECHRERPARCRVATSWSRDTSAAEMHTGNAYFDIHLETKGTEGSSKAVVGTSR
jgi:hypothetical protein